MELSVTEELVEFLKRKNVDFISLGKFSKELTEVLRKRLGLIKSSETQKIEKALLPYLGDIFVVKKGSQSKFLIFKQPYDVLLFRIIQKSKGKKPGVKDIPFNKSEYLDLLNDLIERGAIRVKIDKKYAPLLYPVLKMSEENAHVPDKIVSEEKFRIAYQTLEQGKLHVRICDMRRHLAWPAKEFDAMLISLRDAGKLQLQTGDTEFFTDEDIRDSFSDENGFSKLTMKWRQR